MIGQILNALDNFPNKGDLLEQVLKELLQDLDYINIRVQKKGSQFGFDVGAEKIVEGGLRERWRFECKNLKNTVTVENIAPKLLWQFKAPEYLNKFVIVCTSDVSNDLCHLLETINLSFDIEIWNGNYLAQLISESPNALNKLGLKKEGVVQTKPKDLPIIFTQKKIAFFAYHKFDVPFSYDYFHFNNELIKAYTEDHFKLLCNIKNFSDDTFYINSIEIKTLRYSSIKSRILRQHKMKGLFEPEIFSFSPINESLRSIEVLPENKLFSVLPKKEEIVFLELDKNSIPGYYELMITIKGKFDASSVELSSHILPLHIGSNEDDLVFLNVLGKHYDTPCEKILQLENKLWTKVKQISKQENLAYLGASMFNPESNKNMKTWQVSYSESNKPKEIDLKIPIEEELFSLSEMFKQFMSK